MAFLNGTRPEDVISMWKVWQGRRLKKHTAPSEGADLPGLSISVGSEPDEKVLEFTTKPSPLDLEYPGIRRQGSKLPCLPKTPLPEKETRPSPDIQPYGSTGTKSSTQAAAQAPERTHSIVKGFKPSVAPIHKPEAGLRCSSRRSRCVNAGSLGLLGELLHPRSSNSSEEEQSIIDRDEDYSENAIDDSEDDELGWENADDESQLQRITEVSHTQAQSINSIPIPVQDILSPRDTRRHMLAAELTDSLRKHIVWERQFKHATVNAVLKRRHTSHDLANLNQQPEPVFTKLDQNTTINFSEINGDYHTKGW